MLEVSSSSEDPAKEMKLSAENSPPASTSASHRLNGIDFSRKRLHVPDTESPVRKHRRLMNFSRKSDSSKSVQLETDPERSLKLASSDEDDALAERLQNAVGQQQQKQLTESGHRALNKDPSTSASHKKSRQSPSRDSTPPPPQVHQPHPIRFTPFSVCDILDPDKFKGSGSSETLSPPARVVVPRVFRSPLHPATLCGIRPSGFPMMHHSSAGVKRGEDRKARDDEAEAEEPRQGKQIENNK